MKVTDRLPPHSPEAEQAILGAVMLDPQTAMAECIDRTKGNYDIFYDLRHQTIFRTMVELYDDRDPIDIVSLSERLRLWDLLDQVGGLGYLSSLPDACPSPASVSYYLEMAMDKFTLRQMLQSAVGVVERIYSNNGAKDSAGEAVEQAERDLMRIAQSREVKRDTDIKTLVKKAIGTIEDFHQRQGMLTGLGTGFVDFDKMTAGLHGGEMIVIAARPSLGKTSIAMNIAEHVAVDLGLPVGVFSLEMTADSLVLRMICSRSRVNLRNVRDGFLAERDFPKLTNSACKLSNCPLHIDDSSALSILQLRAKARRMFQQFGIKLFVVDYLQLLHSTSDKADNRQQEISDISAGLKALAKELNVPVIVVSQLNRDVERDKNRKPRLSDLRESGSIEQDADLVSFLYKPKMDDEDEPADTVPTNWLIAKQRNGPTGEVALTFLKQYTRFESAAKVEDEDQPEPQTRFTASNDP